MSVLVDMMYARRLITEKSYLSQNFSKTLKKDEESDSEDDADSVPELENE